MVRSTEKRVVCIIGTRPEAIKLAPVIRELRARSGMSPIVLATSQHRDLLHPVLAYLNIRPDYDLDLMRPDQTPAQVTAGVLEKLPALFSTIQPDWVMVQGDTCSAAGGGLAGFYCRIPVAHVEAGLRTYDLTHPFPEEANRQLISRIATLNLAPTAGARQNLLNEGIAASTIRVTGNTVVDGMLWVREQLALTATPKTKEEPEPGRLLLITAHRRENQGAGLRGICTAIRRLARQFPDLRFLWPLHPNPHVGDVVRGELASVPQVTLSAPLDYPDLIQALAQSFFILTDSGGIQEEAPGLGRPVLVLRGETDRPEAVEAGVARLVGTDPDCICHEAEKLLTDSAVYQKMATAVNPYGDGHAASRIVDQLH